MNHTQATAASLPPLRVTLTLVALAASLAACAGDPGKTPPIVASTHEADLKNAGLDPEKLPAFDTMINGFKTDAKGSLAAATPVMSLFVASTGRACDQCHTEANHAVLPETRNLVAGMWDKWVRGMRFGEGGYLFCDSCHQGKSKFLDRSDKGKLESWMDQNFESRLEQADGKGNSCGTCHGEPFNEKFLDNWRAAK